MASPLDSSSTPPLYSTRQGTPYTRPSTSYSDYKHVTNQAASTSYSTSNSRGRPGSIAPGRRSRAASSIGASEHNQVVCAISEARGVSPSVGVAFINISTGEAVLSQICDTQFYIKTMNKVHIFEPSLILVISTSASPTSKSALVSTLEEECAGIPIVPLGRKFWSETAGLEFIHLLAFREDVEAIRVAIEGNFYATCAFSAVMQYLESEASTCFANHSLRIKYQPSEDTMMIDLSTITSLELIQNLGNAKSKDCLFGLLNQTLTPMGARMLRSNILQPSTQVENILTPRFDALEELSTKEDMFFAIRKALQGSLDVEKTLTAVSIHASTQAINQVLMVKRFLLAVQPIFESLALARGVLLTRIRELCRPGIVAPILDLIAVHINSDVTFVTSPIDLKNQRIYAVKSGVNGLLDVARKTYKEATEDVHQHVEDFNTERKLTGDLRYDKGRKYYLRFQVSEFEKGIPDILVNRVRRHDTIECQTLSLVKLNQRIANSEDEVVMMSDKVIQELLVGIRHYMPQMFRVCESIALLDMLASFGQLTTTQDYARPDMSGTLALKGARHPILDRSRAGAFVPNDYYATGQYRFQVITGCNMSGKSTYIRTVALLQIMAQIGCYIPAQYAAFPVISSLFSRVSTDDSIEANMSTFSVEMREMAFILRNINDHSMAIIDELGRGTSTRDGLAIAVAMSEALVQSGSLVFFATHFIDMAKVLADRPGVLNLHLASETSLQDARPKMTMLYKVSPGPVTEVDYGITIARAMGFPPCFIAIAEHMSRTLRARQDANRKNSQARKLVRRRKLVLSLHETLRQARDSDMHEDTLVVFLRRVMVEFLRRMEEIEGEASAGESAGQDGEGNEGTDGCDRGSGTEEGDEDHSDGSPHRRAGKCIQSVSEGSSEASLGTLDAVRALLA